MNAAEHELSSANTTSSSTFDAMRPGERLRAAREAAGLSLDQVAQQLKLAPRQVRALEEESFDELPGRTFSRGFVRNYARLLNLDADDLLARLPEIVQAPPDGSSLNSTASKIADMPTDAPAKAGFARWLIPLVLVACIVAAAGYEWYRSGFAGSGEVQQAAPTASRQTPTVAVSQLANPLASPARQAEAQPATADRAPPAEDATVSANSPTATPAESDAPLVLTYSGPSWTEIRDRNGTVLVSRLIDAGSSEAVRGAAPFEVVLGNAPAVSIVYLGKPVDLSPYTRQNVARVSLP